MRVVSNTCHSAADMAHTQSRPDAPGPAPALNQRDAANSGSHEPALRLPAAYAIERPVGALSPVTQQPNLYRDAGGGQYIHHDSAWYPVRHDADNGTLRVWLPDRPYKPQYPIRRDTDGNFTLHNNVGLKGGGLFDNTPAGSPSHGEADRNANRQALGTQLGVIRSASEPGSYANSVKLVNDGLSRLQVGLSDQALDRISTNLHHVQNGKMTNAEASSSEYRTFMNDVHDSTLSQSDRNWSRFGAYLNRYAGAPYHAETDIANMYLNRNQDQLTRLNMQAFVQNDPKA